MPSTSGTFATDSLTLVVFGMAGFEGSCQHPRSGELRLHRRHRHNEVVAGSLRDAAGHEQWRGAAQRSLARIPGARLTRRGWLRETASQAGVVDIPQAVGVTWDEAGGGDKEEIAAGGGDRRGCVRRLGVTAPDQSHRPFTSGTGAGMPFINVHQFVARARGQRPRRGEHDPRTIIANRTRRQFHTAGPMDPRGANDASDPGVKFVVAVGVISIFTNGNARQQSRFSVITVSVPRGVSVVRAQPAVAVENENAPVARGLPPP